jgi:ABC-type Fe3+ transport system substrate-binding protein
MALGEFAFEPFSNDYMYLRHKERGDPIGMHVFEDFTPLSYVFYFVRKNARNSNAAKLFALWATGPEAVQIFEKYSWTGNIQIKESRIGSSVRDLVNKKGGNVISWFDSPQNFEELKWYATKEGQDYQDQFERALGLK